jgi:signal transduction histidine kinase
MSTRGRLTLTYTALLTGTLIVFGVTLAATYRSRSDQVGEYARHSADSVVTLIRRRQLELNAARDRLGVQLADSQLTTLVQQVKPDSSGGNFYFRPTALLIDLLRPVNGYFLVYNKQGQLLYASRPMRALSTDDQDAVKGVAARIVTGVEGAILTIRADSTRPDSSRLYIVAEEVSSPTTFVPNISRVVVGVPTTFATLWSPVLTGTIIVLIPVVFVLSVAVAYAVLGSTFRPVEHLINEVEAITDGRSLHRRLPAEAAGNDELARLSMTLNAMLPRLESSFAALRRFTADASHELKTPLTVLRADVERAMDPSTSRDDRMVALEESLQETARMSDLVNGLLTLARADEGRFDLHRTPVEMEPLVRDVYETAGILGEEAGLTLSLTGCENAIVMGDRTRLRQLLLNLVTNAIKYTPRGGQVELSVTRRAPDEIAIAVRDTGIGIAATDLPHVFDRFWRADRARSRASERGGFGLGLSISQWIVQAHGGTIAVQSRLGRGTVFTVVLPAVSAEIGAPAEVVAEADAATESAET